MTTSYVVVFHLCDRELFGAFLQGVSRKVLEEPIRNNRGLRTRYFRGYQISSRRPDFGAVSNAFFTEINELKNEALRNYLCDSWVRAHSELVASGLAGVGVVGVDTNDARTWLMPAHEALDAKGHIDGGRDIVRALALSYPIEEVLIFVSILSVDCPDQAELRDALEKEFNKSQGEPRLVLKVLREQQVELLGSWKALQEQHGRTIQDEKDRERSSESVMVGLREKCGQLDADLGSAEAAETEVRGGFDGAKRELERATAAVSDLKRQRTRAGNALARAEEEGVTNKGEAERRVAGLESRQRSAEAELANLDARIDAVETMLRPTPRVGIAGEGREEGGGGESRPAAEEWSPGLSELIEVVGVEGFSSSPVTLSLLKMGGSGRLVEVQESELKGSPFEDVQLRARHLAYLSMYGTPVWRRDRLGRYAFFRSLDAEDGSREEAVELVLAGLYHSARADDQTLTDVLLRR